MKEKAVAGTAKSPTYPSEEMEEAERIAREIGIRHYITETNELSNENFAKTRKIDATTAKKNYWNVYKISRKDSDSKPEFLGLMP